MIGLTRWIPRLVVTTAILHMVIGVIQFDTFGDIISDGVIDAAGATPEREYQAWFLLAGVALLGLGTLCVSMVRQTQRLPRQFAWYLLGMGIPISLLWLVSGGPLLILLGALALVTSSRTRSADQGVLPSQH
ncbi:DUF6463 family protein [Actinomadura verrucosospora]|uniref:DUF6463 family protein n=1 Tax=Actinomadura verrucosospora TaxID=46165 RepID=UPI001564E8EA|nr:DUF6463 family protein [Actinomadura verrucosospora]